MKRFLSRAFPRMGPTASTSKDSGFVFALKICLSSITPFALCIKVGNAIPACFFEAMRGLYDRIMEMPHQALMAIGWLSKLLAKISRY